jgi:hypothetical protein
MPHYFFDFRQAGVFTPDTLGMEFPAPEDAYLEAFSAAQEMWGELLKERRDPHRCRFEIRNASGQVLFEIPFQEVIDCCTDRRAIPLHRTFENLTHTSNYAKRVSDEFVEELRRLRQMLQESRALLLEKI